METVSRWGDWYSHIAIALLVLVVASLRRRRDWQRVAYAMIIACALSGLGARIGKVATGRVRPTVDGIDHNWDALEFNNARYHAFPSGHTAASAGFFAALAFARRRVAYAGLMIVPLMIGAARIYVGAHYLSDVICGFLLGLLCAWFVVRTFERRAQLHAAG